MSVSKPKSGVGTVFISKGGGETKRALWNPGFYQGTHRIYKLL